MKKEEKLPIELKSIEELKKPAEIVVDFYKHIAKIERKMLKFINQTPESLSRDILKYRYSLVLNAIRSIDLENKIYHVKHLDKEVDYNYKTKMLMVIINEGEYDGIANISRYRLNDSGEFEPIALI